MSNQPPPNGYESWLDWVVDDAAFSDVENAERHCRKELAILRAKERFADACYGNDYVSEGDWMDLKKRLAAIEKEYGT